MDEQLDLTWIDDEDWDHPDPDPRLTAIALRTMTDIEPRGEYL
ncbi:hypothetical protein ACFXKC_18030 [Streptomyces sp. NPDC059340]